MDEQVKEGVKKHAFSYILTLRLMPIFPYFIVSLSAAVLQVPFRTFISATFIGVIPIAFIYSSIGNTLSKIVDNPELDVINLIEDPSIKLSLFAPGLLALLPPIYQKIQRR